jgi:hypothetical protein
LRPCPIIKTPLIVEAVAALLIRLFQRQYTKFIKSNVAAQNFKIISWLKKIAADESATSLFAQNGRRKLDFLPD